MKKAFIVFILLALSCSLFSLDWKSYGWFLKSQNRSDKGSDSVFTNKKGGSFSLSSSEPLSNSLAQRINTFVSEFYAWDSLTIREVRVEVEKGHFRLVILPKRLMLDGVDISANIPAGIYLYDDNGDMKYDFRMMKGVVFMRLKGLYINETELLKKMKYALANPDAYIKRSNPDYMLGRIEELDQTVELLQLKNYRLKMALLALENRNFFGRPIPIKDSLVKKVMKLKKNNPMWKRRDVIKALGKEKIRFSSGEINLIFIVLFNEFQ